MFTATTDFCLLILYLSTLLNLFISSNNFLVDSLGFFMWKIMPCANREFYFFLSNLDVLYFLFLPNCQGITSSTMLNRSGKSRHACLGFDFRGNTLSLSPLSMMLAIGFSWMLFRRMRKCPFIPNLMTVVIKVLNCVKWFFCIDWDDHEFCPLLICYITLIVLGC